MMFEIVKTLAEDDVKTNFVGIANLVDDKGYAHHAGIVIQYKRKKNLFHYTGTLLLEELNPRTTPEGTYFHKKTAVINEEEVPAFIAQARNILKNAKPKYGYFYSGQSYDSNGKFQGDQYLGEYMTCVGFCINVFKGFLETGEEYLEWSEWGEDSHGDPTWLKDFCAKNGFDINAVKNQHRRISPVEILASAFFNHLPITKSQIDSKVTEVHEHYNNALDLFSEEKSFDSENWVDEHD